jgi:predicted Fe-S protein YdhL (DUF1289 family)
MTGATELIAAHAALVRAGGQNVPSPCLSVCRMSPASELCEGCFRTLDEIAAWSRMGDDDKRAVWALIAQRAEAAA